MTDALEDNINCITCQSREINKLRFADDIDIIENTERVTELINKINRAANSYGMEISGQKGRH